MSEMNSLLELLTKEIEVIQGLLQLSKEKQQVLLEGDLNKLNLIVAEEQVFMGKVDNLEQLRNQEVIRLAEFLGLPAWSGLKEVAAGCSAPDGEALQEKGSVLRNHVREIGELNSQNNGLINQSLELIRFFVKSLAGEPEQSGYTSEADTRKGQSLMLDRRV